MPLSEASALDSLYNNQTNKVCMSTQEILKLCVHVYKSSFYLTFRIIPMGVSCGHIGMALYRH